MTINVNKSRITREQFAELLFYFTKKFTEDFVPYEMAKENSPFKNVDKDVFLHERLIMIFWIIDKFFGDEERTLMSAIHKKYFTDLDILNNPEESKKEIEFFMSRYKEYYDAWDDKASDQFILGGVIAKNIFQEEKMVLNANIILHIVLDVYALIKQIRESIIDKYEVIN
ncbi:MAG: hypothetical protein Q8P28_11055 [Deltaproteobacteria bacterium]|nr:hypothetical protein [Deltaproteobacteria bacterium]